MDGTIMPDVDCHGCHRTLCVLVKELEVDCDSFVIAFDAANLSSMDQV